VKLFWQFLKKFKSQILHSLFFIIFGFIIIFILVQFTDFPKVVKLIISTPGRLNLLIFLFLALYYGLKFLLERFLILKLGLTVEGKRIALLFAAAELVREFPTIPILMVITLPNKEKNFSQQGCFQPWFLSCRWRLQLVF
jgi:apolipoprotein N-acyltransferase